MILETRYLKDFLHNIANMEKFLIHVSNLFLAKNFLLRFLRKKKLTAAQCNFLGKIVQNGNF